MAQTASPQEGGAGAGACALHWPMSQSAGWVKSLLTPSGSCITLGTANDLQLSGWWSVTALQPTGKLCCCSCYMKPVSSVRSWFGRAARGEGVQSGPQTLCHFTVNFSSYNVTKSLSFTARMSCVGETLDAMASLGVEEECDDGRTPVSLSRCFNVCSLR